MKIIRRGTFETNSSSTHSITMCKESDFDKWKNGELYYCQDDGKFYDEEGKIKIIKEHIIYNRAKYDNGNYTYKDKTVWDKLVQTAMKTDFSWKKSAKEYEKVYENLL